MSKTNRFKAFLILSVLILFYEASMHGVRTKAGAGSSVIDYRRLDQKPPIPTELFAPSNARTEHGGLIQVSEFISAKRCATCHADIYAEWEESLHRNAVREPFYKASADILERTRGVEFTRHCESCHAPVALFSGALVTGSNVSREMDDEGVTCTVCHSITEARIDGTGSYTIRRPTLLLSKDGKPEFGDIGDDEIMANIPGHKGAMMRPALRTAEFCGACHKSNAPPSLNNYKFTRGYSAYDEWQMSGASTETITPYYRKDARADCRSCHMPPVESQNDVAAKQGKVFSHRFLGGNTTTPLLYGQKKQVELTTKFLQDGVLTVDIMSATKSGTNETLTLLDSSKINTMALSPGDTLTFDVVVFNRKPAHSFPPELRDVYEPWVEFEATDSAGKTIFHSGFLKPDGILDERAHVYKAILLDAQARTITRHQVWEAAIKAFDNVVPTGRSDLARYSLTLPPDFNAKSLSLHAKVNYRRFIQEYSEHVLKEYKIVDLKIPIVKMAETSVRIGVSDNVPDRTRYQATETKETPQKLPALSPWRRWNDYGIALLEQAQYSSACEAFMKAFEADPNNPDPLISAAIAELRMERYSFGKEQIKKATDLVEKALRIKPDLPRAHFYRAVLYRAGGDLAEAATRFATLAKEHPRDREVQRQLGQTLFSMNRFAEARPAFEAILSIDPTDAGSYQALSSIYLHEGMSAEAIKAQESYLLWRDDPFSEIVAGRFFLMNPQWSDVRIPFHVNSMLTPKRPTAVGKDASPAN